MSEKIIDSFRQRRLVDEAVAGLAESSTESEMAQAVQEIARRHSSTHILPALRKNLGTDNGRLRGGLGRLATLLPKAETVALLTREAGRRDNATQTRLNAVLILERFLQEEAPPGLMGDLRDPSFIIMQSLQEALEEGRSNRFVLLEYVRQMRAESQDVAFLVLELLGQLQDEEQPELLRLIAYDRRAPVAEEALARLAAVREPTAASRSAAALHCLQLSMRPDLAATAARLLRKLRLSGVRWTPEERDGLWALVSPCDYQGTQHLWFLREGADGTGSLVGLRLNRLAGILECFGNEEVERGQLPPRRRDGETMSVSLAPGQSAVFAAAPLAYARHCLQISLESHWQDGSRELPEEFTLRCPAFLGIAGEPLPPELTALLDSGPELWKRQEGELAVNTRALLGHRAMSGWALPLEGEIGGATEAGDAAREQESGREGGHSFANLPLEALLRLARSIVGENVPQGFGEQLRRALLGQAGWLQVTGRTRFAEYAVLAAESLRHVPLPGHPLLLQMVALGLRRLPVPAGAGDAPPNRPLRG